MKGVRRGRAAYGAGLAQQRLLANPTTLRQLAALMWACKRATPRWQVCRQSAPDLRDVGQATA